MSRSILFILVFIVTMGIGWVMNLIKLMGSDAITGMVIARVIGVFTPLGAILGYL